MSAVTDRAWLVVSVLLTGVSVLGMVGYALRDSVPRPKLPTLERLTVAVITSDATIQGVLIGVYPDVIVLAHAAVLGDAITPVEGDVVIPRDQVRWMQTLTPVTPTLIPRGGEA